MPATAGRVRMPANNRVHSSAALQTHGIWQSAIGYDPYAPNKDDSKGGSSSQMTAAAEPDGENAYASFQGLLALARITGSNADEARGACKKCGRVGHLTFQCKNFVSLKEIKEKDPEAIQAAVLKGLDKLKGGKLNGKKDAESESEDEESESSDSDVDSEMERIIAERYGKKVSIRKGRISSSKKKRRTDEDDDDDSESDYGERKKRGRSKKRSSRKRGISDSDEEDESRRKRRKEKRKKRDESSDEGDDHRRRRKRKSRKEKRRRRSHRHSDDSESSDDSGKRHRRKSQRHESPSDCDVSDSDRVGRGAKRSEKRSRKRYHEDDE